MKMLKLQPFGTEVQGVRLYGDPKRQIEPESVRVAFPGGDVDVVRCTDGSYWIHVRVDGPEEAKAGEDLGLVPGRISDARLDIRGKHASETNAGDFEHPRLYHLAVRVDRA